ncbi:MAG: carbohydrate ABC transporter permease [Anaerolineae bacterium]|nr:carbohydrate ABC transporter permease [Anaerolineae bacterium]
MKFNLLKHTGTYTYLIILSIFVLFPLVFSFSQSLMTNQEVNRWPPPIIPPSPILTNYETVLSQPDLKLVLWLRNSLFAAAAYTTAVLLICAPAAYAFARLKFPGNNILFGLLLLTVMLPSQVTLIPNFLLMRDLKFLDTFHALIWPGAANVFAVFLLRQFFMQIPQELEEAAILDGASYFGRFRHVILPLSTNALTAMGIFVFLGHYNDLLWPFITTSSLEMRTLPVGLQILNSSYAGQYRPLVLAGAVFATVPIIIVYIIFQRRIIKGVVMTGMGGR